MRFKVGDKARVRKYLERFDNVNNLMLCLEGEVVEISGIEEGKYYLLKEDEGQWLFSDEMLEPIEDPLVKKTEEWNNKPVKMISGENLLNENDPIKPSHYRKGEIDLYESWYRTYPFNEFRAGMQMIAERYMKRDKDNRIQDLDKATYTIKRLKEYEELEKSDIEQALDDLKNVNVNTFDSVEDLMNELEEEE